MASLGQIHPTERTGTALMRGEIQIVEAGDWFDRATNRSADKGSRISKFAMVTLFSVITTADLTEPLVDEREQIGEQPRGKRHDN
jgi:hypothetical protein